MLQRLFDTLTRAEALLERPDDEDKTKVVARVAGEYTQLVYLVEKARAEGCAIADTIAPVGQSDGMADNSASKLSNRH